MFIVERAWKLSSGEREMTYFSPFVFKFPVFNPVAAACLVFLALEAGLAEAGISAKRWRDG